MHAPLKMFYLTVLSMWFKRYTDIHFVVQKGASLTCLRTAERREKWAWSTFWRTDRRHMEVTILGCSYCFGGSYYAMVVILCYFQSNLWLFRVINVDCSSDAIS